METAVVIRGCRWKVEPKKAGSHGPGQFALASRSGRLLLAKVIHELDQLDRGVPVLGRGRVEALLLAVGQAVERSLVLGRGFRERLGNRGLQVVREVRIIGIGSVDDRGR